MRTTVVPGYGRVGDMSSRVRPSCCSSAGRGHGRATARGEVRALTTSTGPPPSSSPRYSFRYQPVLGTELHVVVGCTSAALAEHAQQQVLDEILRLEALLSTYRPDSPLSRWVRDEAEEELPDEVVTVLALAQTWFAASGGAYDPALGRLRSLWRKAEHQGRPPLPEECRRLAAQAGRLPYAVRTGADGPRVERVGDCSVLDLDGLAKGWVVDRAAEVVREPDVGWLMVNVGGDLRLVGPGPVRVAIEDPGSRVDNAPPLGVVSMRAGGLASSGPARRGFRVGERWYGHVLDPRTGQPVDRGSGVTVVASDTASADALATVVGVQGLDRSTVIGLLGDHAAAALEVGPPGRARSSPRWRDEVDFEPAPGGPASG